MDYIAIYIIILILVVLWWSSTEFIKLWCLLYMCVFGLNVYLKLMSSEW